ncbi:MAG: TlpA disulfide reductase family protein [Bacteroidota bacterium]|nr:TlpA disulfide reductase family protein [Bacteroidota bacterium]
MIWIASSLLFVLTSCEESDSASKPVASKAQTQTEVAQATQGAKVSARYKNGTNEANKGDRTGKIRLHGSIPTRNNAFVHLFQTEARNKTLIDSAQVIEGSFSFDNIEVSRGFYELQLNRKPNNSCNIILNPDEADVEVNFTSSRLTAGKNSPNSRENKGWFAYHSAESKNKNEIKNLRKGMKDSPYRKRIEEQIKSKELELVEVQHAMIDQYVGTYLAKYLSWKNPKYASDQGRYFEDMDPLDNSLIHSMAISDRIQGMMVKFSKGEDARFLACIDIIKSHFESNPVTLESALFSMLDGFYNTGKEDICLYILDNYIYDEDCGADLSDVIKQRAEGIVNLQVGKTPPDFTIEAYGGGKVNLYETVKKNKYTLVMFWASWCHKCEQEVPALIPLYARTHSRGFEAIGVSIDQAKKTWTDVIESKGMQYPNVSQLQGWNSPIVKDYKITATPTYFLLNNKGEIVLKPKRIYEVDNFLKQNL